jgi:hypothetical protein
MTDLPERARARELAKRLEVTFTIGADEGPIYCDQPSCMMAEAASLILAELQAERERAIEECIEVIELDKSTFETCGRNTKGHARAIMLCREVKERKHADAE